MHQSHLLSWSFDHVRERNYLFPVQAHAIQKISSSIKLSFLINYYDEITEHHCSQKTSVSIPFWMQAEPFQGLSSSQSSSTEAPWRIRSSMASRCCLGERTGMLGLQTSQPTRWSTSSGSGLDQSPYAVSSGYSINALSEISNRGQFTSFSPSRSWTRNIKVGSLYL